METQNDIQGPLTETGAYALDAMVAWHEKHRLVLPAFERDIYVHDRHAVMDLKDTDVVAWGVNEHGTHIIVHSWTRHNTAAMYDEGSGGCLWFHFDGRTLLRSSLERVDRKLANAREYDAYMAADRRSRAASR